MNGLALAIFASSGAAAGFLAGLFGVGGGLIMVPALVYAFDVAGVAPRQVVLLALGTSMAAIVFSTAQSAYGHLRRGTACGKTAHRVAPWAVIGVLVGSMVAAQVSRSGLLMFVAGFQFVAALLMCADISRYDIVRKFVRGPAALDGFSIAFGGIAAMAGIAGGTLFTPYLAASGMEPKRAVGTSAAVGLPVSLAGALAYAWLGRGESPGHWTVGYVHLPALAALVAGTLLTVRLGVTVASRLPARALVWMFATFLVANGAHLLYLASE